MKAKSLGLLGLGYLQIPERGSLGSVRVKQGRRGREKRLCTGQACAGLQVPQRGDSIFSETRLGRMLGEICH